jgi:hypothetical protein
MAERTQRVEGFIREAQQMFRPAQPESFWKCEDAFRRLVRSDFLADVLNQELYGLTRDTGEARAFLASELVLHRGGGLALSLSVCESPRRYIHSLPYHAMYAAVGQRGLTCNVYELPSNFRNDVFDPTLRLFPAGQLTAEPLEVLCMRSGGHAYDVVVEAPTPILKFMTTAMHPLEWLFTKNGLQAWQANDSDLSFTQLRVAADVAGRIAHQSSLEPLKKLTRHEHHAVRWAAIQNLARLSRSEAVARLREAINDPHPHVQRAARKTLEKLQVG